MADYLDILKEWENKVVKIYLYENINIFFPEYQFIRINPGTERDHWASPFKINLELPKTPNKEKTVIYEKELCFREQGEWDNKIRVVDKIMENNSLPSIYDTYRFISDKLGIAMPSTNGKSSAYRSKSDSRLLSILEDYFVWQLWNNKGEKARKTLAYLSQERGFTYDAIKELRFGFVPGWSYVESFVTNPRTGYSLEDLDRVCNVKNEEGLTGVGFEHTLAIPYKSSDETKGFLFRTINPMTVPKYIASRGLDRKSSFFNLRTEEKLKEIIVVEGEIDALTGTSLGIKGMVAIGGADLAGERNRMVYDAFNKKIERITLVLDLDKDREGRPNYAKRFFNTKKSIIEILRIKPDFKELYVGELPYPCDPDLFIRTNGKEAFTEIIAQAKPWWNYLADYMNA